MPNPNPACKLPDSERSCQGCLGTSLPATLDWHNLDTGLHATLNFLGGYSWMDSSNSHNFYCEGEAVTLHAEVMPNGAAGLIVNCNHTNPINYQFAMSDGSTVVVSEI